MPGLEMSLSAAFESPGVIGAALVDLSAAGEGFEIAELTGLITEGLHAAGAPGELESVVVTSSLRHEVVQAVPGRSAPTAMMLVLVLEREHANLALAVREAAERAESILT